MSDLVKFQFHGDEIDVIPEEGQAWISVRRVCEVLGIDESTQRRKLQANPAAVAVMMTATGSDGKTYEMFCVAVRSLPLWLATIHPTKVSPAAREKLIAYQREAADVLADHFLGRRGQPIEIIERLARLEAAAASGGLISGLQSDHIKTKVALFAHRKVALGQESTVKAASARIQNMIHAAAGWGKTGQLRRFMPAASYPHVCAALHALGVELDREERRRRLAARPPPAQSELFQ